MGRNVAREQLIADCFRYKYEVFSVANHHCSLQHPVSALQHSTKTRFEMKLLILLGLVLPGKLCVALLVCLSQ